MWINSNGAHTCDIGPFGINVTGGSSNWEWIVSSDGWNIADGSTNSLESAKREALAAVTEQIDSWSSQVQKATPK